MVRIDCEVGASLQLFVGAGMTEGLAIEDGIAGGDFKAGENRMIPRFGLFFEADFGFPRSGRAAL
jgi:hypothetical protein